MTKIVFLDRDTLGPSVKINKPGCEHEWSQYLRTPVETVIERTKDADIIITNKVPLRSDVLEQLPKLRLIVVAATGYDVIDLNCCRAKGILVSNVQNYAITTVPEHVLCLIFALRRSLIGYRQDVIDGEWQHAKQFCFFNHPIKNLAGSTLGIIGRGSLGSALGKLAEALGIKVIYSARKGAREVPEGYVSFNELLEQSDIISLHCPLNEQTQNLLSYPEFEGMSRQPLLINTGRGGLANESDVVKALNAGLISGIGFDCLTSEPISDDHPFHQIIGRPNVILTPHVAWASEEAMQILWDQVILHIDNYQKGEPSNVLN